MERSKVFKGIVVVVILAFLAFIPMQFSKGGMFYSPFSNINIEIHGKIEQYADMFGFKGIATYTNNGDNIGERCITITIHDLGIPVLSKDFCKAVGPGETIAQDISIVLEPKAGYAWEYK